MNDVIIRGAGIFMYKHIAIYPTFLSLPLLLLTDSLSPRTADADTLGTRGSAIAPPLVVAGEESSAVSSSAAMVGSATKLIYDIRRGNRNIY